ncbi:MAG TPA: SdrD B-like domain-containing protein [Candidatus Nanoperiomorbaceae bacterium]|nr:SdrD B-like domain-containing protein [Candidatus Nanoperiomorbaceae bacterium]
MGSTVFLDENNNGLQDNNEQGIPGVLVELYDAGPDKLIGTADDGGFVESTTTNSEGDYIFAGLNEGNYYIQVPSSQFGAGMSLENSTLSSSPSVTDEDDNGEDFDDNGIQSNEGETTTSPVIMLMANTEPTEEDAQGGTLDDADDDNGDMTVDLGFVPIRFDLALIKVLANNQEMNVRPGDTIHYRIRVINQGSIAADNIALVDYIPANMSYEGGIFGNDNAGWTIAPGNQVRRILSVANGDLPTGGLPAGQDIEVSLFLTLDESLPAGLQIDNFAEINNATDENGDQQEDIDSSLDPNPNNDVFNNDNDVSGNGNMGEDEDDHDIASIITETFDLALIKELAAGQSMNVEPGDTIRYTITVINQGDIPADNIVVTDYVPSDASFEAGAGLSDGSVTNTTLGWSEVGGNPTTTLSAAEGELPAGGLAPGQSVTIDVFLTLNSPLTPGTVIDNYAELTAATDENGDEQEDVDSEYDTDPDDDTLTQDNEVNGNGNNPGEDDDDHDIATVITQAYDLALIKRLAPDQSELVQPGDTVHYRIVVLNQGMIAADSILVTDYIPSDMYFEGGIAGNGDWVVNGANVERRISVAGGELSAGGLQPGDSVVVSLYLTLNDPLAAGLDIANYAEITEGYDDNLDPQQDFDSQYDNDPTDDTLNADNEVSGNGNNPAEDDDDHDIAVITTKTFDLALIKLLSPEQRDVVEPGDTIHYRIRVINQGDIAADNIEVTDYVPADMTFEAGITGNSAWSGPVNGPITRTLSVAAGDLPTGGLAPGQSVDVDLYLTLNDPLPPMTSIRNIAEISDATDENGDEQIDVDSEYDMNPDDDTTTADNEVNGNGNNPGEDDDDYDYADITTEAFDLALIKLLANDQPLGVEPGDTIHYRIRVINQGMIAADNIEIVDYIPNLMSYEGGILGNDDAGWSYLSADNTVRRTLSVVDGDLPTGGLLPGEEVEVSIYLTLDDDLPAGTSISNFAEIVAATDDNGDDQTDLDSDPDDNPDNDVYNNDNDVSGNGNNGEDEDDHDGATIQTEAFDLALYKELSIGQSAIVEPGDTVYYTIHVVNQGTIAADNIAVTDYIPDGMNFDGPLNPDWTISLGNFRTTLRVADGDLPTGGLQPGATASVEIALILDSPLPAGSSLVNFAEISSATDENGDAQQDVDSSPDSNPNNDLYLQDNDIDGNGLNGGDEDDHDPAEIFIESFDLALIKLLADGQSMLVEPGDTVNFSIQVINQGMIAADNIVVTDYVPNGMFFDGPLNPDWVFASGDVITTLSVAQGDLPAGGLAPGETVEVNLTLVIASPLPQGTNLVNVAEITSATDENGDPQDDIDSTPNSDPDDDNYFVDNDINGDGLNGGDEDDHDIAVLITEAFDLALVKVLGDGQSPYVEPGSTVVFTIEVFNQGMLPADNIQVVDYIPAGLNFAAAQNPDWSINGGIASTTLSVVDGDLPTGGLLPGETVTVDIYLTVDSPLAPGTSISNLAEIAGATDENGDPQIDLDSTPNDDPDDDDYFQDNEISGNGNNGEDEDDHDQETIVIEVFDLALIKQLDEGQSNIVNPGDTITFNIQVFNQGQIPADNIEVVDYLPDGFLFSQAINPNWALNAVDGYATTTLSVAQGELPAGGLQPGFSYTVEIQLIVDPNVEQGQDLFNFAEIAFATDENGTPVQDIDSTPDDDPDNDLYVNDDEITGNGNEGGDEDDHDGALVDVDCYKTPGEDTQISVCLGCAEAEAIVDLFGSLEGNPYPGGVWTDLDGTGLDLSDPSMVVVTGLPAGFYEFQYTIPGVNNCVSVSAILTIEVVNIENLVCNADVNISLGENCEATVSVDNILEGDLPCYSSLEVHIIDLLGNDIGNVVNENHVGMTLFVKVEDPMCNNYCWGTLKVEDKKNPIITCPPTANDVTVDQSVHQLTGSLDTADPVIDLADYSCFLEASPQAGDHHYELISFQVNQTDYYTFEMNSAWGDGFGALYAGGFDPANPCENIIAQSDDVFTGGGTASFDPLFGISLQLQQDKTYYLLSSSWTANQTGSYNWNVYSQSGDGWLGEYVTTVITNPDWTTTEVTNFVGLPTVQVPITYDLICTDIDEVLDQISSLEYTGYATATDNCTDPSDIDITFTDVVFDDDGDCAPVSILRSFTATDGSGNSASCVQEINFRKPTLDDVHLPPFTAVIECDEQFETLPNGNPHPSVTGYPFIQTAFGIYLLDQEYCNIGAAYEDHSRIEVCEGTFKFIREWNILDWCDPAGSIIYNQIIKVGDFTAPEVVCPSADYDWDGEPDVLTYSTGAFSCVAAIDVPLPDVSDNCSDWTIYTEVLDTILVDIYDQYGLYVETIVDTIVLATLEHDAANRYVTSVPAGNNWFRYVVEDDCGNTAEVYCPFVVEDQVEPVAICNEDLNVSIGGDGYARIYAADINEGSSDNCGIASIQVRRDNFDQDNFTCGDGWSAWGDYVDLFCCDVADTITIEMRVTDLSGNINTCWLTVVPEDKVRPYCTAPHDVTVGCDELPYDFDATDLAQLEELFGVAIADDNCEATPEELTPIVNLHDCGFGTIVRRFQARDQYDNISVNACQQTITINEVHNFEIRFPADNEGTCGVVNADSVLYNELACDLLAVGHTDEILSASGDECYKVFRTWKVINWCQYDGESDPFIVSRDEDCDNQPGDEAVWVLHRPSGYTFIDRDNDETEENNVPLAFQNVCNGFDDFWRKADYAGGYYQYTQHLKVYDTVDPEVAFTQPAAFCSLDNENCDGLVTYPFVITEDCTPTDLVIKIFLDENADGTIDADLTNAGVLSGTYPNYTISGSYPIGCHAFEVHVEDGCGNTTSEILPFCVEDCKAPAPICINGLATTLMPFDVDGDDIPDEGRMAIWAVDFIASPIEDCSGPVTYSINRIGDPANIDSTAIVLTCDDLGTVVLEIWAWDGAGNADFCETYTLVTDNFNQCTPEPNALIAGLITTEEDETVEDVLVTLNGQPSADMVTDATGWYVFDDLQYGYDYTVTPQRDGDYLNGVSTFDLVLISKHILGVQFLDSPYKRIAADVNRTESITTLDMIELRKLILSIDIAFSNNTSWRFVERDYVFPNPSNPWQEDFPEAISVNDLPDGGLSNADFVAVKIGDVSMDAVASSLQTIEDRDIKGTFVLSTEDKQVKSGETVQASFYAKDISQILGYQFTLAFDETALRLVDMSHGLTKEGNFGLVYAEEGMITTSWNLTESEYWTQTDNNPLLFSLTFEATADGYISDLMRVSSRYTQAEAYNVAGELLDVAFEFNTGQMVAQNYELYQNTPNPFVNHTSIGFYLPKATQASLKIHDVTGKVIRIYRGDFAKGYNALNLTRAELGTDGVLYYTLETDDFTATRKMIMMK